MNNHDDEINIKKCKYKRKWMEEKNEERCEKSSIIVK